MPCKHAGCHVAQHAPWHVSYGNSMGLVRRRLDPTRTSGGGGMRDSLRARQSLCGDPANRIGLIWMLRHARRETSRAAQVARCGCMLHCILVLCFVFARCSLRVAHSIGGSRSARNVDRCSNVPTLTATIRAPALQAKPVIARQHLMPVRGCRSVAGMEVGVGERGGVGGSTARAPPKWVRGAQVPARNLHGACASGRGGANPCIDGRIALSALASCQQKRQPRWRKNARTTR